MVATDVGLLTCLLAAALIDGSVDGRLVNHGAGAQWAVAHAAGAVPPPGVVPLLPLLPLPGGPLSSPPQALSSMDRHRMPAPSNGRP